MSFNVRNPEIEARMKDMTLRLAGGLPEGWGVTIMIFSFGAGGSMFYSSTAERDSMILAMKEFIKRNEM